MGTSSWSGKWRSLGLLKHPEALEGPPGGRAWRRPLVALVIGVGIVFAVLLIVEVLRDDSPSFDTFVTPVECERGTGEDTSCYEISVMNVGGAPGRARCTWNDGAFTTGVIAPNTHETRTLADVKVDPNGDPTIACTWERPTG